MIIGTAGFTAMLCVDALVSAGVTPDSGISGHRRQRLGQHRRGVAESPWLPGDGRIGPGIDTRLPSPAGRRYDPAAQHFAETRPLEKQLWAGAVDTVGGPVLASAGANAISRLRRRLRSGRGFDLPTTVMPFILRNVRLQGGFGDGADR
ncbi:hypothetical protein J4733_18080 [Klebsiella pneumoniae]|uniref:Uncharacterized protein n=1 Tax=Klebsiella pneumoniae TaxID=573 RepID=A0A939NMT4_KLEPN|nr:hypothetical protein [Klebsiella pneumoniae]